MRAGRRPDADLSETTRQNICQIRGQAFRKIARHVLRAMLPGDEHEQITDARIRLLAKDETFQQMVGEVFIMHISTLQSA